jgi:drug/metabolite transporter (DMT)-like permease
MPSLSNRPASTTRVLIAFAIVYIVWGSTYFFIRLSVLHMPPMVVGCLRFLVAGIMMLTWCVLRGERVFVWSTMRPALISGLLLLFFGNGALIWSEQYLASSLAAILLASGPIWFVLLDKRKWRENFHSRKTITGLVVGFAGVILLFGERLAHSFSSSPAGRVRNGVGVIAPAAGAGGVAGGGPDWQVIALVVLLFGSISWAAGSLYSKYQSSGNSNSVNAGWQMLAAGIAFIPAGVLSGEWSHFQWQQVPMSSWLSILYLITMGSLAGYSAFVWLLQVRSATQVSTHAYVNPVVAVLLGAFFAGEKMSPVQLLGLAIILGSVLLINLAKYRSSLAAARAADRSRISTLEAAAVPENAAIHPAGSASGPGEGVTMPVEANAG